MQILLIKANGPVSVTAVCASGTVGSLAGGLETRFIAVRFWFGSRVRGRWMRAGDS